MSNPVECFVCKKHISRKFNLNRHLKVKHNLQLKSSRACNYKCLEADCNMAYPQNYSLISHLREAHKIPFDEEEEMRFSNRSDFEKWKTLYELENNCSYVVARKTKSAQGITIYFNCNRTKTGKKYNCEQRKRRSKIQGSCKLDFACTSQIKLINNGKRFIVYFQKTHYGHSLELQHLRIHKKQREAIASKLLSGTSRTEIIDSTRDKIDDSLKRIDLLTSKDVDNIRRSYHIYSYVRDTKKKRLDNIMSFDLWVKECEAMHSEEKSVIFCKKQDEASDLLDESQFCLIIMNKFQEKMLRKFGSSIIFVDTTQHEIDGCFFELVTILVKDEFEQGFPVAFMFCYSADAQLYEVLFEKIKEKVGTISPTAFISEIGDDSYHAWVKIMGPVTYHLFSRRHIVAHWQENLYLIEDVEKSENAYFALQEIQEELDESQFENKLVATISWMFEDEDTQDFARYFQESFVNNCESWASCFRKSAGIVTGNLETIHKLIKFRKKENGLLTVLKLVREMSMDRVMKLAKGKNAFYREEIAKRHKSAQNSNLKVEEKEENCWEVSRFIVDKHLDMSCCCLTCNKCKVCLHMYSCTCNDFTCNFKICKHIHLVAIRKAQSEGEEIQDESEEVENFSSEPCENSNEIDENFDEFDTNSDEVQVELLEFQIVKDEFDSEENIHVNEDEPGVISDEEAAQSQDHSDEVSEVSLDGSKTCSDTEDAVKVKIEEPGSSLLTNINETFIKLHKCNVSDLDKTTASVISMYLKSLRNVVQSSGSESSVSVPKKIEISKKKFLGESSTLSAFDSKDKKRKLSHSSDSVSDSGDTNNCSSKRGKTDGDDCVVDSVNKDHSYY